MDQAIIFADGVGIDGVDLKSFSYTSIVGVPQLNRLAIVAQRAGISKITIVIDEIENPAVKTLERDKRIDSEINWHISGTTLELTSNPYLVLQSNLVITPQNLSKLLEYGKNNSLENDGLLILIDESEGPSVKINGSYIEEGFLRCGKAVGAFICNGKDLEASINKSVGLKDYTDKNINLGKSKYLNISGEGYWFHLSPCVESSIKAERMLFSNVGKTATGWISRNINSRFSLPTSRILAKTPLTPNMISILINIIGILSGPFLILGHPVIGSLFLYIATIFDRCDGEVARVKLMETRRGQWVDTISDQFTVFSFFVGVSVGYYLISDSIWPLVLGAINLSIFFFFLVWSFYYLANYTDSGSLVSYFTIDKYVDNEKRSLIRKIILFLRPMSRRNFYAMGFLVVSIIGGYPWLLCILTVAMLLVFIHVIEDIIKIQRYSNKPG